MPGVVLAPVTWRRSTPPAPVCERAASVI